MNTSFKASSPSIDMNLTLNLLSFHLLGPPRLRLLLRRVLAPVLDKGPVAAAAGFLLAVGHVHERDL